MGRSSCTKHITVEPASTGCAVSEFCKICKDEVSEERSAVSQDTTKSTSLAADYHSLPRPLCNRLEVLLTASPAAHKRMIGKSMVDVFGRNDALTKATHWLGLRGHVLVAKVGPSWDVSWIIRQDVSAEKCVAGMVSPPLQHASSSSKVISASSAIANLLGSPCRRRTLFLVGNEIRTVLLARVLEQEDVAACLDKHVHPKASASRSECHPSRDHTRLPRLFSALAMVLTMNARRFLRTHPLHKMGDCSL